MPEIERGAGHAALVEAFDQLPELMRTAFPTVWAPLLRRLADRDGRLVVELGRLEAVLAGRGVGRREPGRGQFEMVAAAAAWEALNVEAERAAEMWRWLISHGGLWSDAGRPPAGG